MQALLNRWSKLCGRRTGSRETSALRNVASRARGGWACSLALCVLHAAFASPFAAQQQPAPQAPGSAAQTDEVVRVGSALVQTGVGVSDRKGHFIGDLESADFELRVDGRPQPITFFERIKGGVRAEVTTGANAAGAALATEAGATPRGRAVLFFVDDLHLAPDRPVAAIARDVETAGAKDLARIPYAEDLTLALLPRGRYLLRVTVTDAVTRASAERQTDFEIE